MGVAEERIQKALLGEAVDAGPALIFVADEDMRYLAVNQRVCEALGYTREELLGMSVSEVAQAPESGMEYDELLVRGFRHGEAELTRKDGTTVSFYYQATRTVAAGLDLFVSVGFVADGD